MGLAASSCNARPGPLRTAQRNWGSPSPRTFPGRREASGGTPWFNPNAKLSRRLWATESDVFIPLKTGRPKTVGLNDGLGAMGREYPFQAVCRRHWDYLPQQQGSSNAVPPMHPASPTQIVLSLKDLTQCKQSC